MFRFHDSSTSITGERSGGLYTLPLDVFLSLNNSFSNHLFSIIGSTAPDIDVLDLWHRRLADTSHRIFERQFATN